MKNVLEFIENSAKNFPDKVAFSDESNSITYIELLKMSKTIGTALVKKNNTKNKPIAVFLDKTCSSTAMQTLKRVSTSNS